jgi:hypothetical protein
MMLKSEDEFGLLIMGKWFLYFICLFSMIVCGEPNLSDEVGTYVLDLDTFVLPERKTHTNLMFLTEIMMGCRCC